jgi:hypothetical protein
MRSPAHSTCDTDTISRWRGKQIPRATRLFQSRLTQSPLSELRNPAGNESPVCTLFFEKDAECFSDVLGTGVHCAHAWYYYMVVTHDAVVIILVKILLMSLVERRTDTQRHHSSPGFHSP